MTLQEAKAQFLNKRVDIDWCNKNERKNATIPRNTTNLLVIEVYENCYGDIMVKFEQVGNTVSIPVFASRLKLTQVLL